jgi:sensor histidine kinase YesM
MTIVKPKNQIIPIFIVSIILFGIFFIVYGSKLGTNPLIGLGHSLTMTAGLWFGCMSIVQYLWKKYPWEQKPVKHLLLEILLILLYTLVFSSVLYLIEIRFDLITPAGDIFSQAIITILITFLITSIYESVYFYRQWKYNFSRSIKLEKDNIEAKYEALKTQVNPHFLFNSLNSLTTMVDDNEKAVDYIRNLSEFLRYMLGSRDKEMVLLREEIRVLENYINLQKSRFGDNLVVGLDVPEKYYHYSLPPLVLQMLTENCIKHNIISMDKPLNISIRAEKESIIIENNLQKKNGVSSTGQGLRNISERFRFFTTKQVKVIETTSIFKVVIPLLKVDL